MKLLFDENLSPRLVGLLATMFPGSTHVREVGLAQADDDAVWVYAKTHGFVIVSKDADFRQMSFVAGFPPKVIFDTGTWPWLKQRDRLDGQASKKAISFCPSTISRSAFVSFGITKNK